MSAYLTVAGIIVAIQVVCVAAVATLVIIAVQVDKRYHRRQEREVGEDLGRVLRDKFHDLDAELDKILKDGDQHG